MNSTLLYCIENSGELRGPIFTGSADHGAIYFWNYLSLKYFETTFVNMIRRDIPHMVWSLFDKEWLPVHERIILGTTLDGSVIRKNEVKHLCSALAFIKKEDNEYFPGMVEALNKYISFGMLGFCWQHSSEGTHYWVVEDESGERLYNFKRDRHKNWFLFDDELLQSDLKRLGLL